MKREWFVVALLVVLVVAGAFGWEWYKASVQRRVYARQGVRITTWEILMGAKPVERSIREAPSE